jgi:hypothetical protein
VPTVTVIPTYGFASNAIVAVVSVVVTVTLVKDAFPAAEAGRALLMIPNSTESATKTTSVERTVRRRVEGMVEEFMRTSSGNHAAPP